MCRCDTGYDGDGFTCNGKKIETRNSTEKRSWKNESFQYRPLAVTSQLQLLSAMLEGKVKV